MRGWAAEPEGRLGVNFSEGDDVPIPPTVAGSAARATEPDIARTRSLCDRALGRLSVDGVCIVVMGTSGTKELVHATDSTIAELDELQFTLGEGPCIDAYRTRIAVLVADLEGHDAFLRWPGFAHEATQAGARAAFAFPLHLGAVGAPFGIVEFYRHRPGPLERAHASVAPLVVGELVNAVLDDLGGSGQLTPTDSRPEPMFGRPDVAQATGMIAVQLGCSVYDALARLRAHAFAQHRPVADLAADVLARRHTFAATD